MSNVNLKEVSEIKDTSNNIINEILAGGKVVYAKKKAITDLGTFGSIRNLTTDDIIFRVKSNSAKTKIGVYRFNRNTFERDVSYFWYDSGQWNVSNITIPNTYPGLVTWYITDSGVLLINCHSVPNTSLEIMPGSKWTCNVEDLGTGYDSTVKCVSYYANMKVSSPSFTQMTYCNDGQYEITYTSFVDDTTGYLYRLRLKRSSGGEESPGRLVISQSHPTNTGWVETDFEYYLTTDYYYSGNVGLIIQSVIGSITGRTPGKGLIGVWCRKSQNSNALSIDLLDATNAAVYQYSISVETSYSTHGGYALGYPGMYGSTLLYKNPLRAGNPVAYNYLSVLLSHGTNYADWRGGNDDVNYFNNVTHLYYDGYWSSKYFITDNGTVYRTPNGTSVDTIDNIVDNQLYTSTRVRVTIDRNTYDNKVNTQVAYYVYGAAYTIVADAYEAQSGIFLDTAHGVFDMHDGKLVFIDV